MPAPFVARPDVPRDCRPCAGCCTYLPIPAGEVGAGAKPAGVTCPRLSALGCRSYARRPKLCTDFRCTWLSDDSWPDVWRPDRSGLMCLREEIEEGLTAAAVYEIRPDALNELTAAAILEELRQTTAVMALIDSQQRRSRMPGYLGISPAEPTLRGPHFVGRHREDSKRQTTTIPAAASETARTRSR